MKLVIVESPTKAKTLSRFLGKDYKVVSSFGHVRDLPKSELGIDIEHDFTPRYITPLKARKQVTELKKSARAADDLILATDGDREGEAIAWHLIHATAFAKPERIRRIIFHEITKPAITDALEHPQKINMHLVNAQQARRVLDRLVGYKLSPFLWKKVAKGLSAGRVQSAAVRLIAEREREIASFIPQEYWNITATLQKENDAAHPFEATLEAIGKERLEKFDIPTEEHARSLVADLEHATYSVVSIEKKETERYPFAPYTTSTLQQDAWRKLRFQTKTTMRTAQSLYEGISLGEGPVGLITYMRTDSVNLSQESLAGAANLITQSYGKEYSLPRTFKTKSRLAQEAHEAIRPTDPSRTPESIQDYLDPRQYKLYSLIWKRFIASQMSPARFHATTVSIHAEGKTKGSYMFKSTGQTILFEGFLRVYPVQYEEKTLPELSEHDPLALITLLPQQHFTKPPARYTEATLVKKLEEEGIGRPSTYAPIMSTIQDRGYVEKDEQKRFRPTETGMLVNDLLVTHFPQVVDIKFTAHMEEDLDEIADGRKEWVPVIEEFYTPFAENLEKKTAEISKEDIVPPETTDEICVKCGKPMIVKFGRFGKFLACSGFPECKTTKSIQKTTGVPCPKCGAGELTQKKSKRGRLFFGCNTYPACDFALWQKPTGEKCPICGSLLVQNRAQILCSSKECGYIHTKDAPDE